MLHSMQALSCLQDWKENIWWYVYVACNVTRHKGGITSGSLSQIVISHTLMSSDRSSWWMTSRRQSREIRRSWTLTPEFLRRTRRRIGMMIRMRLPSSNIAKKITLGRVWPFQHEQFRAVEFISRAAELIFLFILHTFWCGISCLC